MLAQIEKMKQLYCECMDIHMAEVAKAAGVKEVELDWSNVDLEQIVKEKGIEWMMQSQSELIHLNRISRHLQALSEGSPFVVGQIH